MPTLASKIVRLLAAGACLMALCLSDAAGAQSYDRDPAPRLMEPAELSDGPILEDDYPPSRPGQSRVVPPRLRGRGGFEAGYPPPGQAFMPPSSGTMIISRGQCIPYDPAVQPGACCAEQPFCAPPPFYDEQCDETYEGHFKFLCDWYEHSSFFCPEFWQNFSEFGGVQAFKSPVDLGINGNFGFYKGVNWAVPLADQLGVGVQLGASIALSDFEGRSGPFGHRRDQYFVTGGLFRRATYNRGLQGGAVVDYLHDEFYVRMNLLQIRSELSYVWRCGHEVGLWAATHVLSDNQTAPTFVGTPTVTWQSTNQYNLFYRRRFNSGATARMWVGLTDHADVTFGSDATAVLAERWAIQASYNYIWPCSSSSVPRDVRESFGATIGLVWYPGYKVPNACFGPYRPLFNVADNTTMITTAK
jgi:hypothetical protein